jgi:hypothetical protein
VTRYRAKQTINAARWNETNFEEMVELLKGVVDHDATGTPCVYVETIEPYFISSLGNVSGYSMLQFYAGDDMEVDPGMWVVVYEDNEVEIMEDFQFHRMFEIG